MDLNDLLNDAKKRGFTHNFALDLEDADYAARESGDGDAGIRIVETNTVDLGTDPGDDATIYLIETSKGLRGYVVLSDSFHADSRKAAFVDRAKHGRARKTERP